jgi:ABC-type transport system, involved in lipoprotein release, permease component
MKLAFKIAWRFLKSSKGQSILIAIGIAIGVSVQVFIGSLIQGLQKSLVNKTVGRSSHITVLSNKEDKTIDNYKTLEEDIKKVDSRIEKISSSADGFAFIKHEEKSYSVQVRGFDMKSADKIYSFGESLVNGTEPKGNGDIIIGKELSKEEGLKTGDKVELITSSGNKKEYSVSGIFDLKVAAINKGWVVMSREDSQKLFGIGDKVTQIETQFSEENVFIADEVALKVDSAVNKNRN